MFTGKLKSGIRLTAQSGCQILWVCSSFFGFYIFLVIDIFVIYNLTALSGVLEVKKNGKKICYVDW